MTKEALKKEASRVLGGRGRIAPEKYPLTENSVTDCIHSFVGTSAILDVLQLFDHVQVPTIAKRVTSPGRLSPSETSSHPNPGSVDRYRSPTISSPEPLSFLISKLWGVPGRLARDSSQ
jgi:hypothetical protein